MRTYEDNLMDMPIKKDKIEELWKAVRNAIEKED